MSSPAYNSAYDAIARGDDAALDALLTQHPGLERERGERIEWPNATLLEHAVWFQRDAMVARLVTAGAPLTEPGGQPPMTPLARALEMGADDIAKRLGDPANRAEAAALNRLENLDPADDDERRRAFRLACLNGARDAAIALAPSAWCSPEALTDALLSARHLLTWDEGETAWDWARYQLELADPANLFEFGTPDGQGRTLVARINDAGLKGVLPNVPPLAHRSPPDQPWRPHNSVNEEAFMFACQWGQTERVSAALTAEPALINTRTMWHMGALYLPGAYSSDGSTATALLLLDAGAPPYDGIGGPAWWGSADMVATLLERGAPPELEDSFESGLLHACAASRFNDYAPPQHWLPIIDALLDAGANPNFPNRYGVTPWGFAADELRQHLESRGAEPAGQVPGLEEFSAADDQTKAQLAGARPELLRLYEFESGCSAALHALLMGKRDAGEQLIAMKSGPDLNEAAALGDVGVLRGLLDVAGRTGPRAGASPEGAPLHIAAALGHGDAASLLVERGYSPFAPNGPDVAGDYIGPASMRDTTPTHLAVASGNAPLLRRFIELWERHWGL